MRSDSRVAGGDSLQDLIREAARHAAREAVASIPQQWLSLKQFAEYVGIAEGTAAKYVAMGVAPPSVKIAHNARRFRKSDIDKWCAQGGALGMQPKGGA